MKVALDPIGKKGKLEKTVTVYSNDAEAPVKKTKIYAFVKHDVALSSNLRMEEVLFQDKCKGCHANRGAGKSGKSLYDAICAFCHGEMGEGKSAKPFKKRSDGYLRDRIANGQKGTAMPAYSLDKGGPLDDAQIDSLVDYVRGLAAGSD